ncbi:MAG: hypothetical protein PHR36_03895 [Patescibacteria group bacterium]|nr:hypothetical protein [Patescibacteria group bacterium]
MKKSSKIAFFGLAIILIFTLTGCGQKSSPGSSGGNDDGGNPAANTGGTVSSDKEAGKNFKQAVEVELPASPALETEEEIRPILKNIFGDLKVTGYSNDVYGAGSLLVEYTPSKKPAPAELPNVTKALKDMGYTTTIEHVDSNVGTAMYEGSKYTLTVTINTATPIVGVSYIKK